MAEVFWWCPDACEIARSRVPWRWRIARFVFWNEVDLQGERYFLVSSASFDYPQRQHHSLQVQRQANALFRSEVVINKELS